MLYTNFLSFGIWPFNYFNFFIAVVFSFQYYKQITFNFFRSLLEWKMYKYTISRTKICLRWRVILTRQYSISVWPGQTVNNQLLWRVSYGWHVPSTYPWGGDVYNQKNVKLLVYPFLIILVVQKTCVCLFRQYIFNYSFLLL